MIFYGNGKLSEDMQLFQGLTIFLKGRDFLAGTMPDRSGRKE